MRKRKAEKLEKLSKEFQKLYIDDEKKQEYLELAKPLLPSFSPNYFLSLINECQEEGLYGREAEEKIDGSMDKYAEQMFQISLIQEREGGFL